MKPRSRNSPRVQLVSFSWTRVRPPPAWLRGQEVSQTGALAPACLPARVRSGEASGTFGSRGRLPRRLFSRVLHSASLLYLLSISWAWVEKKSPKSPGEAPGFDLPRKGRETNGSRWERWQGAKRFLIGVGGSDKSTCDTDFLHGLRAVSMSERRSWCQ